MLPAPAQGAIAVVCRVGEAWFLEACKPLNDTITALCTHIERDFLRQLMGGCSTPIAALAVEEKGDIVLRGNICSSNGAEKIEIELKMPIENAQNLGKMGAKEILNKGGDKIIAAMR